MHAPNVAQYEGLLYEELSHSCHYFRPMFLDHLLTVAFNWSMPLLERYYSPQQTMKESMEISSNQGRLKAGFLQIAEVYKVYGVAASCN